MSFKDAESGQAQKIARRAGVIALALSGLVLVGCGSESTDTSDPATTTVETTSAPDGAPVTEAPPATEAPPETTPAGSPYDTYVSLAATIEGAEVIERSDAAIRASLLCGSDDMSKMLGGVPLTEFPTDLALVRAYCPDKEPG